MELATLEPALVTLVAALTGIEASCVVWENAPQPRHNGRLVRLSWVSRTSVGIDETTWSFSADEDELREMTPAVEGLRELSLQVAVEVTADQRPGYNAAALTDRARTRMRFPSSLAALAATGAALATVGPATQADYPDDNGRMVSRSLFEVLLNSAARETDAAGATSYIANVESAGTVQEPDGTDAPDTLQPTG